MQAASCKQNLIEHADNARLSRELVRLVCDAPLAGAARGSDAEGHSAGAAAGVPRGAGLQDSAESAWSAAASPQTGATVRNDVIAALDRKPASKIAEPEAPQKIEVDVSKYETVTDEAALDRWIAEASVAGLCRGRYRDRLHRLHHRQVRGHQPRDRPEPGLLHPARPCRRRPAVGDAEPASAAARARPAEAAAGRPGGPQDRPQPQVRLGDVRQGGHRCRAIRRHDADELRPRCRTELRAATSTDDSPSRSSTMTASASRIAVRHGQEADHLRQGAAEGRDRICRRGRGRHAAPAGSA